MYENGKIPGRRPGAGPAGGMVGVVGQEAVGRALSDW